MTEKPPRQYAAEIQDLPTREERAAALEKVPKHLRALVMEHVRTTFELRKWRKRNEI